MSLTSCPPRGTRHGQSIGRYLAKVISWDFEVSDDDPVVNLELLPVRPSEVDQLLNRNRAPAA